MSIKDPQNPLYGKENTEGRGYTKYYYTVKDIARITGRARGTIWNDISKKKLIMDDLLSVSLYVHGKSKESEKR